MGTFNPPLSRERFARLDIILILFLGATVALSYGLWAAAGSRDFPIGHLKYGTNVLIIYTALLLELPNLYGRGRTTTAADVGVWSAIVTVVSIVVIPVISAANHLGRASWPYLYPAGLLVFCIGVAVRAIASKTLGRMFDHALVIRQDHTLITGSIYGLIRHPAYLGSLLMVLASCGLWCTYMQLIPGALFAMLIAFRIAKEEQILVIAFGSRYRDYQRGTWRLMPFLY